MVDHQSQIWSQIHYFTMPYESFSQLKCFKKYSETSYGFDIDIECRKFILLYNWAEFWEFLLPDSQGFGSKFLDHEIQKVTMILVTLWWKLISDVGGTIIMLATYFVMLVIFSMHELIINISNLSPTHLVSNINVTVATKALSLMQVLKVDLN